ncbi:hypothetical protein CRG98_030443 [Punica granatum]|uniref:DC1 domain-containing protein n=1 Tax=Punica granatum TaxID=22663 RepID=A0A2I0IYW4_PUNGR|nr:hypothetical protein CRG98_030443 [Punica granatum]
MKAKGTLSALESKVTIMRAERALERTCFANERVVRMKGVHNLLWKLGTRYIEPEAAAFSATVKTTRYILQANFAGGMKLRFCMTICQTVRVGKMMDLSPIVHAALIILRRMHHGNGRFHIELEITFIAVVSKRGSVTTVDSAIESRLLVKQGCRAYHCINCNFFLHKSCVELPPEIQHPSHPQYPLALISSEEGYRNCSGCHDDIFRGYRYQCDGCQVALHVGCAAATLPTSKEEHQDEQEHKEEIIQHFAREHPLASFHVNAQLQSMRMPDLRLRLWLPCLHIRAAQIMRPDALRDNESSSPSTAPAHLA